MVRDITMRRLPPGSGAGRPEPGDFWWEDLEAHGAVRSGKLYLTFPPAHEGEGVQIHWAYCSTAGWKDRQPRWWDGDLERPTVAGSWGVQHYHCWVHGGIMMTDPKSPTLNPRPK